MDKQTLDLPSVIGDRDDPAACRQGGDLHRMSSGAAVAGALRAARDMPAGTIVTLLPDRGDRYLSTTLFRSTCACCPP